MAKPIYELEEFQEPEDRNIMIVDSLNLAFRWKYSGATNFKEAYLSTVQSLAKSYSAVKVFITCDYGKSTYRKNLYPEYKADREEKVASQTEEEKEEFDAFFKEYEETVNLLSVHYPILKYRGVEADDIAAYLTHYALADTDRHIWLISSDKDWDNLITPNVSRFSFVTRKEYTFDNFEEQHGYPLEYAVDIKVLEGGKDNVKGIPGVGPVRALQLVKKYGSALDIYDQIPLPGNAVYIRNTNAFKDNILRNIELIDKVTYCEDAIPVENREDIDRIVYEYDLN